MSLTTDKNDPMLKEGQKNQTGQHSIYLVLSEEERANGWVRPYRDAYIHVGRDMTGYGEARPLTDEEKERYDKFGYVAYVPKNVKDSSLIGVFLTKDNVHLYKNNKLGGCGTKTNMGRALSETYAKDPKFYGATFCTGCNKHLPVDEFIWAKDGEIVGS